MTDRRPVALAACLALVATSAFAAPSIEVFSPSGCGCRFGWIEHLEKAGLAVTNKNLVTADLGAKKTEAGLKQGRTSCHTGFVGGRVVEGHVPAAGVTPMPAEKPDALGLAMPDMPAGSPGMGESDEPYDVLLVMRDGTTSTVASDPR